VSEGAKSSKAPPPPASLRLRIDWPEMATRLAAAIPRDRLHPRVLTWAEEHRRSRRPWTIAFSGGADSLALLLLLWAHWPERRERLIALHFNHRLRGSSSAADARFCAAVARALRVGFRGGEWARAVKGAGEAQARAARHEFFATELKAVRAQALWLGHQQDDIAETQLMRLARGSGTGGLAAPRPVQLLPAGRVNLRPLLTVSKAALTTHLRAIGASWREDATNTKPLYFRNRLRADVLPRWVAAAGRDAIGGAALARERLEEDDEALEAWLDETKALGAQGELMLSRLQGKPKALWRRALHRWLLQHPHESDLSRHGFEDLLSKVRLGQPTRFSLGPRAFACIDSGCLVFARSRATGRA
jgi:tRNA(Ile)-lysidine synthase